MSRSVRLAVPLCAVSLAVGVSTAPAKGPLPEPDEGPDPRGLTVSGSGVALLKKPSRLTESTIRRAVRAAQPAAQARAKKQAQTQAVALAAATGLTLGEPRSFTLRHPDIDLGFSQRYCFPTGRDRQARCRFPVYAVATVTVTYATAETSVAATGGRILVAAGAATARVRPRDRNSSASIRRALLSARRAAMRPAAAELRQNIQSLGRASGATPGAVFSVAEVRRPFDDINQGSFGPGRYCGTISRPVFGRRDPRTNRRRIVRRVRQRRCFFASEVSTILRITAVAS